MNAALFFILISSLAAGTWAFMTGDDPNDVPEQDSRIIESEDQKVPAVQQEETTDSLIHEPSQDVKKQTPKDPPQNSGENLDAATLDDLLKDAAELIL